MDTEIYNIFSNLFKVPITLNHDFDLGWVPVGMLNYFASVQWTAGGVAPNGYFYLECSGEPYVAGTDILSPKGFPFFMREQLKNPTVPFIVDDSQYNITAAGKNAWNVTNGVYSFVRISYKDLSTGTSTAQLIYANLNQKG